MERIIGSHCIQVLNRVNNQSRAGCDQQHIRRHPHVTIARSWNPKLTDQVGRQRMIDHALRQWVSYSPFFACPGGMQPLCFLANPGGQCPLWKRGVK